MWIFAPMSLDILKEDNDFENIDEELNFQKAVK